nr:PREDICTED: uncharacterized protein LOC105673887 [Linepithema humile]
MEPLFELSKLSLNDLNALLPRMKNRLMSGTENTQVGVVEQMIMFLKNVTKYEKGIAVRRLVKLDMISTICNVMQTSNEDFVNVVLECFDLISSYKEFYDNHAAMDATESMIKLSYLISKSRKDSTQFEKLLHSICNILVRSSKLAVNLDIVCVPKQILFFLKHLDIQDLQKVKLKFAAVTILNVILQQIVFDETIDIEMSIDICRDALKLMTDIVKYGDEEDTILRAAALLCGVCAGASRICNIEENLEENQIGVDLNICQKKDDLSRCIYNTMMNIIIPYVKDTDMSHIDSIEFQKNFVFCLNNLYQLKNCNEDNLSNHLTANGYLKYFLYLTAQFSENLRRSICTLLSRILSVLGKTAFSESTISFANNLCQGFLELPKDSKQWKIVIARNGKDGTSLMILLYYHFHGTQENDMVSLESLIARIMLFEKFVQISDSILKPLWFLFAVTSVSQPHPNLIRDYENAVKRLTFILQSSGISKFYTHHIDLLHYCLKCPAISNSLITQVLDLWLRESDGDVRPLLSFNCDRVIRRLLVVVQIGYPKSIINLALKGLHHVIQIKDDKYMNQIVEIVWHMLPNILSSYQRNTVSHIEAVLELANIIRPIPIPIHLIMRSADSIINIILKKNIDSKLMTSLVTQAYIVLVISTSRKSFQVLLKYIQQSALLIKLYIHGFSKQRSQLSAISVKLLAFIVHCQQKFSVKCTQPLTVDIKNLFELLIYARKSPLCVMNGIQLICELLTQNIDGSAIVLRTIAINSDVQFFIDLYELLHIIHNEGYLTQKDMAFQCLIALLHFAKNKIITSLPLLPHLCTVWSNYDLISHVVNMRYISCHFVEFVTVWLHYRKATCNDVPWNPRSLFKSPFDEVLDHLKEYSVIINNKGLEDTYLHLQRALSQFE